MRLDFLRPLYEGKGDYASVYLDASRTTEDAADLVGLRWRAARERLAGCGAPVATLDALEALVTDRARAGPGLAAFAREGAVVFAAPLAHPPRREIARYARLPHLMPLLAQFPPQAAQVRVRADRAGGEVIAVQPHGGTIEEQVSGPGWPVHKTSVGGWSQARYQRSAEEAWAENAKRLAEVVTDAAARVHAELIVVAGDARARALLLDHLGHQLRDGAVIVDREISASDDLLADAADEAVQARAEEQAGARLEQFRAQLGAGQATEGMAATLAALRDGQASDVFIADDPSSTVTAWIGPDPADVAATRAELEERGVEGAVEDRADAAVVCGATATGAELHFVPSRARPPRSGVGALLRYPVRAG